MCQLCDEADTYLAQLEAKAKTRAEEQRKPGKSAERDSPPKTEATVR